MAVIGMSGRFPGAPDVEAFWANLREGRESVSFFRDEELLAAGVDPTFLTHPNYVRASAVLDGVDRFDASFFGYSPREAESIDPQQRLFLEEAWHALEDAGYDPSAYDGDIGVYAGCAMSTYLGLLLREPSFIATVGFFQVLIGNDKDYLPSRTSYKLNLTGPSVAIQSACSTSLVAVGEAYHHLLNRRCDMALAGGATIRVPHRVGYHHQDGSIYSPDGHCRAFDASAEGTVFGNGVGVVVLKRLADALRDRDHIRAVIRGVAVNNDGSLKVGFTAPGLHGQAEVIATAQAVAGVPPDSIGYVEAHGTGTPLGDPVEIEALTQAFREETDRVQFCAIGSVKTNVGHLDAAAGVASLIKTILALEHREIPPSLHFERPNAQIDFAATPFFVAEHLMGWQANGAPRRAGVSSFGIGGTNAHVVLEEAPPARRAPRARSRHLVLLSALTSSALDAATGQLASHLSTLSEQPIADIAYTTQVGRRAFPYRRALVCRSHAEAGDALRSPDPERVVTAPAPVIGSRPVSFLFPGQGAQRPGMAGGLYRAEPAFRSEFDRCAEGLRAHLGVDLRDVVVAARARARGAVPDIERTALAQPAIFAVEYALARTLMRWGIHPDSMVGHSIGEYVAACLAGVMTLDEALWMIAERGRLMQSLPRGSMIAVPLAESDVSPLLGGDGSMSVAAINDPSMTVVSGPTGAIERLRLHLEAAGLLCRPLHTSHAFHSPMMDPIVDPFRQVAARVVLRTPAIPYVSTLTGTWATAADATDPSAWARQVRAPVRFHAALSTLLRDSDSILLEVGPGTTLGSIAARHPDRRAERVIVPTLPGPRGGGSDEDVFWRGIATLWVSGVKVDWHALHGDERRSRVSLPTYPFERSRYWVQMSAPPPPSGRPEIAQADMGATHGPAVGKRPQVADWFWVPVWRRSDGAAVRRAPSPERWLVLENGGIGHRVTARLRALGHDVVTVQPGRGFRRHGERGFDVDPGSHTDHRSLVAALEDEGGVPARVLHLWLAGSVRDDDPNRTRARPAERSRLERGRRLGFDSLVSLGRVLGERANGPIEMAVVTAGLHAVTGEEELRPEVALAVGPARVIPQEVPLLRVRMVDVDPVAARDASPTLVDRLIQEASGGLREPSVALRGSARWVRTVERFRLGSPAAGAARLRPDGAYLITGGLGGMGLTLAAYLSEACGARLALVGRTPLPERPSWDAWMTRHGGEDPATRRIRAIRSMEASGGTVVTLAADVSDPSQIAAAVRAVRSEFGELHGVIHAAGVAGGGIVALKTREAVDAVLAPKVEGVAALIQALGDASLDFFVLCSSVTAELGGPGQVDYCAANAYLDAVAGALPSELRPLAIAWDTWADVGMAVDTAVPASMRAARDATLRAGITSSEGVSAFARALGVPGRRVIVSTTDLPTRFERSRAAVVSEIHGSPVRSGHRRPALTHPYVPPSTPLERTVVGMFEDLLGIDGIGIEDDFFDELGGHSLLATQVVSRVRADVGVDVPLRRFFDAPTAGKLAAAVEALVARGHGRVEEPALMAVRRDAHRARMGPDGTLLLPGELLSEGRP